MLSRCRIMGTWQGEPSSSWCGEERLCAMDNLYIGHLLHLLDVQWKAFPVLSLQLRLCGLF